MIDQITSLAFSFFENRGVYALLVGSGVSRAAHIPTGWEVTLDLVRRVAALEGVEEQSDWAKWHRDKFGKEPSYSDLLDQIAQTQDERRSVLHSYIEPTDDDPSQGRKVPTKAHHAIARLVQAGFIRVIVTTNFDRLLENALREAGVEPTIIKSDDDLKGAVPLIHSKCFILKLHGDYLDTRIRNTDRELASYSSELNALLDRIFDEHGLITCGWSGDWDPALVAAITRAPNRRYPLFWATRGKPSEAAADLIAQRGGRTIPIESAESFFESLERLISVQSELQRPNPRSIELMVASTKKYLAKPEFRIQLGDLIGDETRHLIATTQGEPFGAQGNLTDARFLDVVGRYEASSEPLARIFGILGRWGMGSEFNEAVDTIARFGGRGSGSGLVVLLALQTYPAVLLFFAYGMGLLKAKRFADLFRLFSAELIISDSREPLPMVQQLFLGAWKGCQEDAWWKKFPDFEKRKTPFSDHLHDIFGPWLNDYLYANGEFTYLFEEFELLAAIAYITQTNELKTLKERAIADSFGQGFVWAPPGRIAWDSSNRDPILRSYANEDKLKAVLGAGFGRGSAEYFNEAISNLQRLFGRIAWR